MADKIYTGDVGVTLRVSTSLDLTTATTTQLKIRRIEDGSVAAWTATVYGDAADGVLQYVSVADDFSVSGLYQLQAYVELSGGAKYYGNTVEFQIYEPYY